MLSALINIFAVAFTLVTILPVVLTWRALLQVPAALRFMLSFTVISMVVMVIWLYFLSCEWRWFLRITISILVVPMGWLHCLAQWACSPIYRSWQRHVDRECLMVVSKETTTIRPHWADSIVYLVYRHRPMLTIEDAMVTLFGGMPKPEPLFGQAEHFFDPPR